MSRSVLRHLTTAGAWILWPVAVIVLGPGSHWPATPALVAAWLGVVLLAPLGLSLARTPTARLRAAVVAIFGAAATCAYLTCLVIRDYQRFYHLGTPISGLALLILTLPLLSTLNAALGTAILAAPIRWYRRPGDLPIASGARPSLMRWRLGIALGIMLVVALGAVTLEMVSSRAARSGEGEGAGDLRPFFASYLGR